MAYNPIGWQNSPSTSTPLDAANLSAMDAGIENAYGLFGTFATMPVASAVNSGIIYFATDTHQTFQSNGSAWVLLPAGSIAGAPVASTAPTTGQVLTYNGTDWVPQASTVPVNSWINMTLTSNGAPLNPVPSTFTNNIYSFELVSLSTGAVLPAPSLETFTVMPSTPPPGTNASSALCSLNTVANTSYGQPYNFPYSTQSVDSNFTWAPATGLLTVATAGLYRFEMAGIQGGASVINYSIVLLNNGTTEALAMAAGYQSTSSFPPIYLSMTANQAVNIMSVASFTTTSASIAYLASNAIFLAAPAGLAYPVPSLTVTKL